MAPRTFTTLPPLSLYVHLPWCVRKCPYCDFNSHEQKTDLPEREYIDALIADLTQEVPDFWGRTISSVFIGGGTPSLFSASALDRLLSGIRALTGLAANAEITLEANPGTVEQQKFCDYRKLGINRLSLGIQSFDDATLQALGRIHSGDDARRAVTTAQAAGFTNINLDLMFGLPHQSQQAAIDDVLQAIALQPSHISHYELTLEPNTLFARHPPQLPDDDNLFLMQSQAIKTLAEHGYARYEISAYAQPKQQCQHNQNYWLFGDYIGIGAGAHGKLSFANQGEIRRRWKQKHPAAYLRKAYGAERIGADSTISWEDTGLEFMMNALRLIDGFPIPLFQTHTGVLLDYWQPQISAAMDAGLLEQHAMTLRASEHGLEFLNDLLGHFTHTETMHRYPIIPLVADQQSDSIK